LVSVHVAKGDTAWLPCRHPRHPDDTVSLVLWYRDHASKPFLSYDARTPKDIDYGHVRNYGAINDKDTMNTVHRGKSTSTSGRMALGEGGTSLLVRETRIVDEAEYRCRVHFRRHPTW
ncbi:unnamed protein product, partial [Meganyctiphanes norvegica]